MLPVMVVRTLAFVIVRRVLGLVDLVSNPDAKDVEIAVLRHQLTVLRRQVVRPRYTPQDRMVLAVLARWLPRERWPVFLVTPATLLRWHRELVAHRWTYRHTGRGQQGLDAEVVDLVVRMARENPRWGYLRIVGECRKLGIRGVGDVGAPDPAPPPARASTPTERAELDGVPAGAGQRDVGVRLLHGRDSRPDPAVCAVCRGA
jgi:hypothetical protein